MSEKDLTALFNIGYGLYVITTRDGERDNGMICNSVMQLTSSPERIGVTINKSTHTHATLMKTGRMNVNCLTTEAPFKVFEAFGFRSGRDVNKFEGCTPERSENGLAVLPKYINSYISLSVESYVDLDTHGMFICAVTEAKCVTRVESMTYAYYHKSVKPRPEAKKEEAEKRVGYICTVCGFVYDEDDIPDDYVCPLCNHGREVFEKL